MKILVLGGSGKIGSAVAWDLVQAEEVEEIGLVGRRISALELTRSWLQSPRVTLHAMDITDKAELSRLMRHYQVGVLALPDRRTSYRVAETAIDSGLNIVDMLEEYHRRPDPYETEGLQLPDGMSLDDYGEWLHGRALENGVTFLDGIGFAPGLSNITLGEALRRMDKPQTAVARVGGIPTKDAAHRHPLKYMITWAFSHVLREYMVKLKVIKDGQIVEVDATTDRERFRFSKFGKDEELECAVTPGMPSFIYTRPGLREFAEKTIRWPGHWQGIDVLKECGLLDLHPVTFAGREVIPRQFFLHIIEPKLIPREGDRDVCVMWNTAMGEKAGRKIRIDFYMWEEADPKRNITAMARTTGFPAAIGALMVGRGEILQKGIVAPEDAIFGETYRKFMQELEKREIRILQETREE